MSVDFRSGGLAAVSHIQKKGFYGWVRLTTVLLQTHELHFANQRKRKPQRSFNVEPSRTCLSPPRPLGPYGTLSLYISHQNGNVSRRALHKGLFKFCCLCAFYWAVQASEPTYLWVVCTRPNPFKLALCPHALASWAVEKKPVHPNLTLIFKFHACAAFLHLVFVRSFVRIVWPCSATTSL